MALDLTKFKPAVQDAIDFLAPYFRISKEQLENFCFPKITSLSLEDKLRQRVAAYYHETNELAFEEKHYKDRTYIGHEVGHYLHANLNNPLWDDGFCFKNEWGFLLIELVAYYAEQIYVNKGKVFENPLISLPNLARENRNFCLDKHNQGKLISLAMKLNIPKNPWKGLHVFSDL